MSMYVICYDQSSSKKAGEFHNKWETPKMLRKNSLKAEDLPLYRKVCCCGCGKLHQTDDVMVSREFETVRKFGLEESSDHVKQP